MDANGHHTPDDYRRYEALLHDFRRHIEHYCFSRSRSADEAADLVQAVLEKVWNGIGTLRPDSTPRQVNRWLRQVMRSAVSNWFRRGRVATMPLDASAEVMGQQSYDADLLDELLAHLNDDERALLQERFAGYTSAEIGEKYGISANAVDQRMLRIVNKLKRIVKCE